MSRNLRVDSQLAYWLFHNYYSIVIWDSLGPSPALALYHIAAQGIEFEKRSQGQTD